MPPAPADTPHGTPRRCDHCGRTTTDWVLHERGDDHGPVHIVWCTNATACEEARRTAARQSTIWLGRAAGHTP